MTVRVRIAPSPTGDPHVGTAYMALFNYVFARKQGGRFLLRIEDTDRARSTPESEQAILRALGWLGLRWDEGPDVGGSCGPYRQSERTALYREHAERLLAGEHAYRCFCAAERLEALRKAQRAAGTPPGYDGKCRAIAPADAARRASAGEAHVVRMNVPREGATVVRDRLRGEVAYDNARIDDQVLLKSDGFPTYHLANVVDDRLMGITHVIRAEEWLPSTPKHVLLYRAFSWDPPEFIHMPLLRNADKSKISKRRNPVSLDYYRDAGVLPEALVNYLALMGWSIGADREKFTLDEMVAAFDIDRVSLGGPVFDLEKLAWLNGQYLRALTPAEVVERLRQWRLSDAYLAGLVPLVSERIRLLSEFVPLAEFFLRGDLDYEPVAADLVPRGRTAADVAAVLDKAVEVIDADRAFSAEGLEAKLRAFATENAWKTKDLFMALRVAVTGRTAAPPLFSTMAGIGRELCRRRMGQAAAFLRARPAAPAGG